MSAKQPRPSVALVIVNKNGHPHVYDCVKSVLKTEYRPFEVVFFDNASTDGSHLTVKEMCARNDNVLLLRSPREISLARATNLAVDAAAQDAEYIGLLDSDVLVTPGWLAALVAAAESNPNIGACQSLLVRAEPPDMIDGTGDFVDFLGHAISRHSGMRISQIDLVHIDGDIFSARSAAMIVRRELYRRVGGLDESLGIGFEDVDLGWRIRLAGFTIRLVRDSLVVHKWRGSTGRLSGPDIVYLGVKNRLQMLIKNYDVTNVLKLVPLRLALDLLGSAALFLGRRRKHSQAVLGGLAWNFLNARRIMERRSFVQTRVRTIQDSQLMGRSISNKLLMRPIDAWRSLSRTT
jgi:GT2 family glycosyltransferase